MLNPSGITVATTPKVAATDKQGEKRYAPQVFTALYLELRVANENGQAASESEAGFTQGG